MLRYYNRNYRQFWKQHLLFCNNNQICSPVVRQGFKPLSQSESPPKKLAGEKGRRGEGEREEEFFSPITGAPPPWDALKRTEKNNFQLINPLQRTLAMSQGIHSLADCRTSELPQSIHVFHHLSKGR